MSYFNAIEALQDVWLVNVVNNNLSIITFDEVIREI